MCVLTPNLSKGPQKPWLGMYRLDCPDQWLQRACQRPLVLATFTFFFLFLLFHPTHTMLRLRYSQIRIMSLKFDYIIFLKLSFKQNCGRLESLLLGIYNLVSKIVSDTYVTCINIHKQEYNAVGVELWTLTELYSLDDMYQFVKCHTKDSPWYSSWGGRRFKLLLTYNLLTTFYTGHLPFILMTFFWMTSLHDGTMCLDLV